MVGYLVIYLDACILGYGILDFSAELSVSHPPELRNQVDAPKCPF